MSWDRKQALEFSKIARDEGIEARAVNRKYSHNTVHLYKNKTENFKEKKERAVNRFVEKFGEKPLHDIVT